jgi:phosphatidylserine decarboxylase
LPQGALSRSWGWLARQRHPGFCAAALKRTLAWAVGIDMSEAEHPMRHYRTLEDLFVRRLRHGARRIDPDPGALVSPVDGTVGACGPIEAGLALQVKGKSYSLARLTGGEGSGEGVYATFYLAPYNYHRVHAPLSGQVKRARLIPGKLLPVFPGSVASLDDVFVQNERIVTYVDHPEVGEVVVVMVGATLVGRMTVAYDDALVSNDGCMSVRECPYAPPRWLRKGEELGTFHLGSTVVLLAGPGVKLDALRAGAPIRMGERIGTLRYA